MGGQAGFRPVDPAVAAGSADQFPTPAKLWRIADLGGWPTVDQRCSTRTQAHHEDLHEGHRMTTEITRRGDWARKHPGARPVRNDGTSLRFGVSILWLSVIVLLPLAAIAWQSVGGGWRAFELAVTSNAALESFRVTLTVSAGVTVVQHGFRFADRVGSGTRRLPG